MLKKIVLIISAIAAIAVLMAFTPSGSENSGGAPSKRDLQQQIDDLRVQVESLNVRVARLEAGPEKQEKKSGFQPSR